MKIFKILIAATALTGFAGVAQAQDTGAYVGIGATTYEFDTVGIDGKLGYNFNEYFGVEGQGILGVSSDTETIGTTEIKAKVDYTVGAFGVVRMPVAEQFEIFGRAGYHQTGVSLETNGVEIEGDVDGFAVGGGAQFNLDPMSGIRAEYTYLDGDGANLDTFSIGYVRKF